MLINKWLLINKIGQDIFCEDEVGICLRLSTQTFEESNFYDDLQLLPIETAFVILLSGADFDQNSKQDLFHLRKLLSFLFLPSYYRINQRPLIFIQKNTPPLAVFLNSLKEKCQEQAVQNILIKEIDDSFKETSKGFVYFLETSSIDFEVEIKKWIISNINENSSPEIEILIPIEKKEVLHRTFELEEKIKETEDYKIANLIFQKQKQIDGLNYSINLKEIDQKNMQFYLDIQKDERIKDLKWYQYEYEILPKWYKQFGHIIKVLMGKRTFRSLFNDNIKKYKN